MQNTLPVFSHLISKSNVPQLFNLTYLQVQEIRIQASLGTGSHYSAYQPCLLLLPARKDGKSGPLLGSDDEWLLLKFSPWALTRKRRTPQSKIFPTPPSTRNVETHITGDSSPSHLQFAPYLFSQASLSSPKSSSSLCMWCQPLNVTNYHKR